MGQEREWHCEQKWKLYSVGEVGKDGLGSMNIFQAHISFS